MRHISTGNQYCHTPVSTIYALGDTRQYRRRYTSASARFSNSAISLTKCSSVRRSSGPFHARYSIIPCAAAPSWSCFAQPQMPPARQQRCQSSISANSNATIRIPAAQPLLASDTDVSTHASLPFIIPSSPQPNPSTPQRPTRLNPENMEILTGILQSWRRITAVGLAENSVMSSSRSRMAPLMR